MTTQDVVAAVQEQNIQVAAGQIGAAPAPESTPFELSVNTQGRLVEKEEFENIIIRAEGRGRVLRVKDVARVELGSKVYTYDSRFNGEPSSSIGIYQLPGANALNTAELVRERMEQLASASNWPEGLVYGIPFDSTTLRPGVDFGSLRHLVCRGRPCRGRDLYLPSRLACHDHSCRRDSRFVDRDVRDHDGPRILDQHAFAVRGCPCDRDCCRRRNRRCRKRDAAPLGWLGAERSSRESHGRDHRPRDRDHIGPAGRCLFRVRSCQASPANCSDSSR